MPFLLLFIFLLFTALRTSRLPLLNKSYPVYLFCHHPGNPTHLSPGSETHAFMAPHCLACLIYPPPPHPISVEHNHQWICQKSGTEIYFGTICWSEICWHLKNAIWWRQKENMGMLSSRLENTFTQNLHAGNNVCWLPLLALGCVVSSSSYSPPYNTFSPWKFLGWSL